MKLWVVYRWIPYEGNDRHVYFLQEENAIKYRQNLESTEAMTYGEWEIEEVQTED